ncbi:MAG TPA: PQQ-dependent sugar dehydrogenase [Arenimonas sp.]|nr:PQQ-dependent sugar dehydrogenase [Arenimonas sp.]
MKSAVILFFSAALLLSGHPVSAQKVTAAKSADYTLLVAELQSGLQSPWGMAFLPDKRLLVTQKTGQLLIVSADGRRINATLGNLPAVADQGQGGLLDVALDPGFATNGLVYWSYAEPGVGREKGLSGTAVARGRLQGDALTSIQVIYRQKPKVKGSGHFGSRLVFARDKTLYITLGERQKFTPAQDMAQSLGKVVRINRDGSLPKDNPKWLHAKALPEIYSLGHRNPQGAALHPLTGELWVSEHGPQGGDEINRVLPGRNYGWPSASYGCNYGEPVGEACRLGGGRHTPKYVEPLSIWVPTSVAPSNFIFYSGQAFPKWQGQVLMGSLAGTSLWRVQFAGGKEMKRERMLSEFGERIRDVEQGPDGLLYLLTDSGKLLKISPLPDRP